MRHPETDETVILCRSADRRGEKRAIHDKFSQRIVEAARAPRANSSKSESEGILLEAEC
jgi:hypothetical protein